MDKESDKLIAALAAELTPVRPMRLKTGLGWLAAAVLATLAVTVLWFGLRADLMAGTAPPLVPLASGLWLLLGLATASSAIALGTPEVGRRSSGWRWTLAMAALLPAGALVTILRDVPDGRIPSGTVEWACVGDALALGLMTAVPLILWLRRAAPVSPERAGVLVGIASGSIGIFAFSLHCPIDGFAHLGLGHAVPVLIAALVGRLLLPRFLRW